MTLEDVFFASCTLSTLNTSFATSALVLYPFFPSLCLMCRRVSGTGTQPPRAPAPLPGRAQRQYYFVLHPLPQMALR